MEFRVSALGSMRPAAASAPTAVEITAASLIMAGSNARWSKAAKSTAGLAPGEESARMPLERCGEPFSCTSMRRFRPNAGILQSFPENREHR